MTEKMLEQERDIEACRKAGVPDSDLPPIPIPSSGAHYVAATLHHKKDGTSELVIIDPLGEKGEVNRSYQQEIQVIEDGFKERFNITSVKRNQGNVIFQSDHNSCGAACVFNLETQLNGSRPKEGELGIENNRGKLQFEPGAAVLRFNQKENLEKADALIREKVKEPIKVVVKEEIPQQSPTISEIEMQGQKDLQEAITLSLIEKVKEPIKVVAKEEIPQQSPTISVKDINKKLTEIEMQDEKALQEAIALSLNPNRQVDQDVIKSQQKILDQFSLIKGKNAGNLNPSQTPPIAENPSRKRKER